ncbi:MAG: SDR family NAD(P)-dependent oxidoreductase [Erythrobacter sp.]|nr:SDR family NAD(P)-dependent oxidoreductase [Erythrobacter sp.]
MKPLEGKSALVTGAAGGIGARVAALLEAAGARTTGVDRAPAPACHDSRTVDLSDAAQLASLCADLAASPPDILVNIAGVLPFGLLENQNAEALALCYQVNLVAPAQLMRAVAGPMRQRGRGQIVNIGSGLGSVPYPWFAAYSSSKAGLAALSQALRRELQGSGVVVTHICPRAAKTPLNNAQVNRFLEVMKMQADDPEWVAQRIVRAIVQKRTSLTIGVMEGLFAKVNALAPRLIDSGLAPQVRKARAEFC